MHAVCYCCAGQCFAPRAGSTLRRRDTRSGLIFHTGTVAAILFPPLLTHLGFYGFLITSARTWPFFRGEVLWTFRKCPPYFPATLCVDLRCQRTELCEAPCLGLQGSLQTLCKFYLLQVGTKPAPPSKTPSKPLNFAGFLPRAKIWSSSDSHALCPALLHTHSPWVSFAQVGLRHVLGLPLLHTTLA